MRSGNVVMQVRRLNCRLMSFQKEYFDSKPEYEFVELPEDQWKCKCICGGIITYGWGASKTKAKKEAAYEVLRELI